MGAAYRPPPKRYGETSAAADRDGLDSAVGLRPSRSGAERLPSVGGAALAWPGAVDGVVLEVVAVERRVTTAADLDRMTPQERQTDFESRIVRDLSQVPPEFLDRVRARVLARLADEAGRGQRGQDGDGSEPAARDVPHAS